MIPKFPSALNVHDILTCPPSESEEGIKDTSVAKHPAGKEEHSVSWPTRPICSSQGDFGHYHMVSNFSWVIYRLLSSCMGSEISSHLSILLPTPPNSIDSKFNLGPCFPKEVPASCRSSALSLTYIHPCPQAFSPSLHLRGKKRSLLYNFLLVSLTTVLLRQ